LFALVKLVQVVSKIFLRVLQSLCGEDISHQVAATIK